MKEFKTEYGDVNKKQIKTPHANKLDLLLQAYFSPWTFTCGLDLHK